MRCFCPILPSPGLDPNKVLFENDVSTLIYYEINMSAYVFIIFIYGIEIKRSLFMKLA